MKESKSEQIRKLLENNKDILLNGDLNNAICYDGIIDENAYNDSTPKILVLLKETNGEGNIDDWDYVHWLKHQQVNNEAEWKIDKKGNGYWEENVFYPSTFRKLCHWLAIFYELANPTVDMETFLLDEKIHIPAVRYFLDKSALINLKKTWGKKQSNAKEIHDYATNPSIKSILIKQINIIDPEIVLCCSPDVFWTASKINNVQPNDIINIQSNILKRKNQLFVKDGRVFVSFYHPQLYRYSDKIYGEYAKEVFSWALEYLTNKD